jgi:hypothetical protein
MRIKSERIGAVAAIFLLIGAVGWFVGFAGWPFKTLIESPNSEPQGIILDSKRNVYCGSKFYGRIQKYDDDGRFIRGYSTEGGTGWGSSFSFTVNEKDQLCITVSGISKDNKGSIHRTRTYDDEGKLLNTETIESDKRDYIHHMTDTIIDTFGNRYIVKGGLFPRVIKKSPSGEKSTIIITPILIWFFQGPLPAFAFFFISMMVLIFLGFKANAKKLSVPTTRLMFNAQKLPSLRKFLLIAGVVVGIAVFLCIIIAIGLETYPMLVIFGFLTLWVFGVIIFLLVLINAIVCTWRCATLDFSSFKKGFSSSLKERYEASMSYRSLMAKDPLIQKMGRVSRRIGIILFLIWLAVLLTTICVVLYLDYIGVWQELINQ